MLPMMKIDFRPTNDDDVVETVKFTRKELRAIATMAQHYSCCALDTKADAARRLSNAIDKKDYGDWSNLFLENH